MSKQLSTLHDEIGTALIDFLSMHMLTLFIAFIGGFILFILKMKEHFDRPEITKMTRKKYYQYCLGCFFLLPFSAITVTAIYLVSGDKINPILALQIGLTSPAILNALFQAYADKKGTSPLPTEAGA